MSNPQLFKQEEWQAFSSRGLHLIHLNINGLQPQIYLLEGMVETNLEQSYEKNHIATNFKDSDRNDEETDIETPTVANMTISNNKYDSDILNNKKNVFPNVSYANILKQTSGMRTPSNLPAYVPRQLTSPISQVSESDLYLRHCVEVRVPALNL